MSFQNLAMLPLNKGFIVDNKENLLIDNELTKLPLKKSKFMPSPLFGPSNNDNIDSIPDATELLQLTIRRNKRHLDYVNEDINKYENSYSKPELAFGVGPHDVAAVTELIAFKLNACVDLDVVQAAEISNTAIAYNVANSHKKRAVAAFVLDNKEPQRWSSPVPFEFATPTKQSFSIQTEKNVLHNAIHNATTVQTPCLPAIILRDQSDVDEEQ